MLCPEPLLVRGRGELCTSWLTHAHTHKHKHKGIDSSLSVPYLFRPKLHGNLPTALAEELSTSGRPGCRGEGRHYSSMCFSMALTAVTEPRQGTSCPPTLWRTSFEERAWLVWMLSVHQRDGRTFRFLVSVSCMCGCEPLLYPHGLPSFIALTASWDSQTHSASLHLLMHTHHLMLVPSLCFPR